MMQIGQLAKAVGLKSSAIRYYEDRGLLQASGRSAGGYRLFDDAALQRLRLIQFGQRLGFSLDDLQALFGQHGGWDHDDILQRLDEKMAEAAALIQALNDKQATMQALKRTLEATWTQGACLGSDELAAIVGQVPVNTGGEH
ncbi:MerR family transcriptional regulator [Marinobacter caseinilyticus]|uniref:MerR family transcriptional regulator n=1 Tax=Marinobacter caseinilyticus TaxID=2692195 RepID=UPI001407E988|nr:MerR family transcriptional regulator [Marinobacter caseinilyticus]